ncbi:MAG: dihydrodipicolinate synthase family protein [Acidobacteriaceae bacterium]|jgi:dihydrodipicolinate synthase/N-acetylneuraminate lyase
MKWYGVMPAMTTCFDERLQVDHAFATRHLQWLLGNGCTGIIALGSLGEAATLAFAEKEAILRNLVAAAKGAPVVGAISALSTEEAVALAKMAEQAGCSGLMVLPPYVYQGDWRETKAHMAAIFRATPLGCMLYNNPVSYGTDFVPEQIGELAAEHANLVAVKESSTDVRRVTAIRALTGDRLQIFVGVDDAIVEGIAAGAVGWVAGLVNAFPAESVALFDAAQAGRQEEAFALYRWFLPLLRMDTVPKFIQLIKQVQQETGTGCARVRPPRLEVTGAELEETRRIVKDALHHRPSVRSSAFPG